MNHFCHICGKLVDLIGLQPGGSMTDSHRKAAEEWVRERAQIEDRANWITVDTAHLAGQECGEQRAVEGICRRLRYWQKKLNVAFDYAADIESGAWREKS